MKRSLAPTSRVLLAMLAAVCVGCGEVARAPGFAFNENHPPRGVIDEPPEGATVAVSLKVAGWAGDDHGIRMIRVLVDGDLAGVAGFVTLRPDVSKTFPRFKHGTDRHGWEALVEIRNPGPHTLRVDAVDTDGASATLGTRLINVAARPPW